MSRFVESGSGRPGTVPRTRFGRRCVVDSSTGQETASMMRRSRSAAFPGRSAQPGTPGRPHALQGDQGHRGTEHGPPGPRNCSRPGGAAAKGPRGRLRFPEPSPSTSLPPCCPAGRRPGWHWRRWSCRARTSCCSTSRPTASTRRRWRRCSPRSAHTRAIPLVTHDEGAVEALSPERVLLLPDGVEDHRGPDYSDLVALA
jgi:hypothetical protein